MQPRFRVRPTSAHPFNVCACAASLGGVALNRCVGRHGFNLLRRMTGEALAAQRLRATWRGCTFLFPALDSYCGKLFMAPYEPEMFAFLARIRNEPFGFIDGGANFGYWSVLLSGDWFDNHSCVAIEASGQTYAWLERNRIANGNRFVSVHAALHCTPGRMLPFDEAAEHARRRVIAPTHGATLVPSTTVDDTAEQQLPDVSAIVVKLDVEGAEPETLAGAVRTRRERECIFLVEDHGSDDRHRSAAACFDEGLCLWLLRPDGTTTAIADLAAVGRAKVHREVGYNFLACQPRSQLARRVGLLDGESRSRAD